MKYENWGDFKKSFTQEQEDAVWQYLIDHAQVQKNGFLGIQLYVRDVDDFWRRVYARYTGDFQRYSKIEKENKQQLQACVVGSVKQKKIDREIARIQKEGSPKEKLLLWINRKTRKALFDKVWTPK